MSAPKKPMAVKDPQVTKEGIRVAPGQVWRDLDERMGNRHCRVSVLGKDAVMMQRCDPNGRVTTERMTRVSIRRMHKSATGWALVSPK